MTENKRFTLDDENDIIFDNNNITDIGIKEIYWLIDCDQRQKLVDLLNALHEENEKLHDEIFRLRTELAYDRTEKEEHSYSVYDFKKKLEKW